MATMTSSQFRTIVEPILAKEFDGVYNQRKDEWKAVFNEVQGTARAYHEEPMLYGFGAAPELPEGTAVTFDSGGVLYVARYLYKVYGLGFAITQVLVEDGDHISIGKTYAKHLAQSMIETKETVTANVLNRAFNTSYTGGDGKALCVTDHPTAAAGNFSNALSTAAALSQTSLEQMLIQIRNATDHRGKKITLTPKKLVIPTSLMFTAQVLLQSTLRSGTANNDINVLKGVLEEKPAVISRLTSTTAWWVQTDAPEGLKLMMRRKMTRSSEGDFETDSMKYKATERYGTGWTDPRGIYGTAGV
jgi:hypothetical protein